MTLSAEEMERIVTQVSRGEELAGRESEEAAEFRAGVTEEVDQAREIAEELGLDFQVEIPNETPLMW
jgi:hypothetical protein